jgi:hypothetical protein
MGDPIATGDRQSRPYYLRHHQSCIPRNRAEKEKGDGWVTPLLCSKNIYHFGVINRSNIKIDVCDIVTTGVLCAVLGILHASHQVSQADWLLSTSADPQGHGAIAVWSYEWCSFSTGRGKHVEPVNVEGRQTDRPIEREMDRQRERHRERPEQETNR